jgi:hypothetical protein
MVTLSSQWAKICKKLLIFLTQPLFVAITMKYMITYHKVTMVEGQFTATEYSIQKTTKFDVVLRNSPEALNALYITSLSLTYR